MKTAIDSSVLWSLIKRQPGFESWQQVLWRAGQDGELVVCPIVFAEISPAFTSATHTLQNLQKIGVRYEQLEPTSAYLAGEIHTAYRRAGGHRTHILPDFLIAAHARLQADRLAAVDRGYLRHYFPDLPVLAP
tara:strand:- start:645 stop:1043 length:399 start_codon:yes stop_codon:yes gene_type:complete